MHRVLFYYYTTGYLDVVSMGNVDGENFVLPRPTSVNNCIYRNMHSYRWIANIDTDELLVPRKYTTLTEFLNKLTNYGKKTVSDVVFESTVFYTDYNVPFLSTATYFVNNKYVSVGNAKTIIHANSCLKAAAHGCKIRVAGTKSLKVRHTEGASYHYKRCETARVKPRNCAEEYSTAQNDSRMMEFKEQLEANVKHVLQVLKDI
jgi:hypothetical protein